MNIQRAVLRLYLSGQDTADRTALFGRTAKDPQDFAGTKSKAQAIQEHASRSPAGYPEHAQDFFHFF